MNNQFKTDKNGFKPISNISVLITEDCNFACEYCFVKQNPNEMSWETLKQTINWLSKQNINKEKLSINFFGGEPLMRFDLIKKAVLYAENEMDDDFSFGITTNGSLFNDERLDFFEKHDIGALFSIDGTKEIHNKHRKYKDGSGTFDEVEINMKKCVERGLSPVGRPTYTPETLPYLFETVKYLLDEVGFNSVSPTPAVDGYIDFTEEDYKEYQKQFDKINKYFKDKILMEENAGLGYYDKCYRQFLSDTKMQTPCGAGKKYLGVNYKGELYPCHRFVQWPEWKLGDVYTGLKYNQRRKLFHDFDNDSTSEVCKACDNKFCGGGCYAVNYSTTGDVEKTNKTTCELSKLQWENALSVFDEMKNSKKFQNKYRQYFRMADEKLKDEVGFSEKQSQNHNNNCKNGNCNNSNLESLIKRINNLERAVSSMSQILFKKVEEENYND